MIEAGMEAILIKIAGIGLNVEHLARSLEEMKPTLLHLVSGLVSDDTS
jgi:diphthine-ammonia ligase